MDLKFPKGFLFGAATSSHQTEGGNKNDWTEWEKSKSRVQNLEFRIRDPDFAKKFPDYILSGFPSPLVLENYISDRACDHYNRFREDFDIAKSLGHNAHRFSIEWSRIEPEEGRFDEGEIEHYREVIKALRERGIEPFVTLWHWTIPLWLRDLGGVESKRFPEFFARFSERVVEEFKGDVKFWMTLNEPTSVIANSYWLGKWPPQKKNFFAALRVFRRLAEAHRRVYRVIHKLVPDGQVGFGNLMEYFEPYNRESFLDRVAVAVRDFWVNRYFLFLTQNTHDYFALQYYFHLKIKFPQRIKNDNEKISDTGWELYPKGLCYLLSRLAEYQKPIFITENGLADARDEKRSWFIKESLNYVARAIQEGADVRGYFHWSLFDNFEWSDGFWPRFGLVEVDYKTMARKMRPSAFVYKQIIEGARLSPRAPVKERGA